MLDFYSRNDVTYNGDVYSIPFPYIKEEEIHVYLDNVLFTDWFFLNDSQIRLRSLPEGVTSDTVVSVRRVTNIDNKVVTYTNNTLLNKENLNLSQDQLLFAVQEIYDNNIQNNIDIRAEVDEKVERVSEAVEKLEFLEDSVKIANEAALEATEQAQIATEKAEETLNTFNEAMTEIDTLRQDSIDEVNQLVADHTDDLNALDQLIKKDADAIINRVGLNMFDTVIKDHILTYEESKGLALQGTYVYKNAVAGSRYGYADFYNKVIEEYNAATQTETVNGVTIKVNSNGHKFYDIADKTAIDEFYNSLGSAWFYGVDVENERIFLPRDKYFAIKGRASVIGNGKALGFTDGTYTKYTYAARSGNNAWTAQPSFFNSAQGNVGETTNNSCEFFSDYKYIGLSTDPTKSGLEAQLLVNEDKYLYICVGNTTNYEGVTDVVNQGMEILEQVNLGINSRLALDVSNISDVGKQEIISWAMPDYTAGINITSLPYTAPKDGLISILGRIGNGTVVLKLNNTPMTVVDSTATGVFVRDIRVKKGDVLDKLYGNGTAPYNDSSRNEYSMFYPLKGAN